MDQKIRKLLDCCFSDDDDLSNEATVITQALVEKQLRQEHGNADQHFESELSFNEKIHNEIGFSNFYEMMVSERDLIELISLVLFKLYEEKDALNAARILKHSARMRGVEKAVSAYLNTFWKIDEEVSSALLSVLWDPAVISDLNSTLREITLRAHNAYLKDYAAQLAELG